MRFNRQLCQAVTAVAVGLAAAKARAVVTINTLTDINDLIGATTFYNNGFTGASAVVANIEAGYVWNQHILLTQNSVFFSDPSITGQIDLHATAVGSVIDGQYPPNPIFDGIAFNTQLWSGAIATSWNEGTPGQYSGSFNISPGSFSTPYYQAMISGVPEAGGGTADVITSSWNDSGSPDGASGLAVAIDAMASMSGKTVVFSAGNGGPTADTVDDPASGTNAFVAGGLMSDLTLPPFNTIADFSSRGPNDFFIPSDPNGDNGAELLAVRARVDITAPATDLVLAYYGGSTGGNAFGGGIDPSPTDFVAYPFDGTSFAAPIVASGAALVVDAGKTLFPNDPKAIDGRVIKAVLMNAADRPADWNNGQTMVNGVVTTTQSLDYNYGSGIIDLNKGWTQYTGGTADLTHPDGTPTLAGGSVMPIGWVMGQITHQAGQTATVDYTINTPQLAGTNLTATLVWYSNALATPEGTTSNGLDVTYGSFDNLDLSVFLVLPGGGDQLVATSDSLYNSAEELTFALPDDGTYMLEVEENNYIWNFNGDTTTPFGLAWATSVPEPASMTILFLGGGLLLGRRRQIRARA